MDFRPPMAGDKDEFSTFKIARLQKLADLGLAEPLGPAQWRLAEDLEVRLRQLGQRGDVIARLHQALGAERQAGDYVLDSASLRRPVLGRLAARGLDDELKGSAYVVIDGVDGRAHHVRLASLEAAGDGGVGAVVEARWTEPKDGRRSVLVIAVRSLPEARAGAVPALEALGYAYWADDPSPDRLFFVKGLPPNGPRTHHVHVVDLSMSQDPRLGEFTFADRLLFRNYLRAHPEEAKRYAALKRGLAAQFTEGREAYTQGKTEYVYGVMQKARKATAQK